MEKLLDFGCPPKIIEPGTAALELQLGEGDAVTWQCWGRLDFSAVAEALPDVGYKACHFFGPSANLDDCHVLVGYSQGGLQAVLAWRSRLTERFSVSVIPDEVVGRAATHPSIRLAFKTPRARDAFLIYMDQVRENPSLSVNIAMMLSQLAMDPVLIDVAATSEATCAKS